MNATDWLVEAHLSRLTLTGLRPSSIKARGTVLRAFADTLEPRDLLEATRTAEVVHAVALSGLHDDDPPPAGRPALRLLRRDAAS